MVSQSQQRSWEELVEQVRKGAGPEEALGLKEPLENISAEEFWKRLEVKGVSDTPLSFLPPDLNNLLEGIASPPIEELVVLPPCICLDTVLQPEFIMPPPELLESQQQATESEGETKPCTSMSRGKRMRETTPEPSGPHSILKPTSPLSIPQPASPELCNSSPEIIDDDVIDLTQD